MDFTLWCTAGWFWLKRSPTAEPEKLRIGQQVDRLIGAGWEILPGDIMSAYELAVYEAQGQYGVGSIEVRHPIIETIAIPEGYRRRGEIPAASDLPGAFLRALT